MLKAPITVKRPQNIARFTTPVYGSCLFRIYCFFIQLESESLYMQLPAETEVKIQLRKTRLADKNHHAYQH